MFEKNMLDKRGIFERALKWVIAFALVIAIVAISSVAVVHATQAASPDDVGIGLNFTNSKALQPVMSADFDDAALLALNSTFNGNHDGSEGIVGFGSCDASGWVYDTEDVGSDVTVQILSDSVVVTTTLADVYRDDLTEICQDGTCGFGVNLWGLISPGSAHQITAQAYDPLGPSWIDLPGTPKTLTCWGYPEGVHDGSEGVVHSGSCSAFGWAFDPDDYDRDVTVQILSDSVVVTTTLANLVREDINPLICPQGTCGFEVNLWGLVLPGVAHQIEAQVYDQESASWTSLNDEPKSLTCWGYPEGVHDGSEGLVEPASCEAFGWAFDPDDVDRDVTVRILSDGDEVATTLADGYRGDVNPVICPQGTCGFSLGLWKLITPLEEHLITAQAYDQESASWIDLDDEPRPLTCWGYELYLPLAVGP